LHGTDDSPTNRTLCERHPLDPLGLGDSHCFVEVVVRELGIDDGVAVLGKVGRLHAAGDGLPTVQEEDGHGDILEPAIGMI